tara:strand:+ start:887 stop:1561 length:675 start_codon:yes stop_codon:yes gene_type:complete
MNILKKIKSKLIVSCQPVVGGPLDNEDSILSIAEASVDGGAVGLRINDQQNVYNVKKKLNVPVIGIKKRKIKNSNIIITPLSEDINSLADSGADIIAFDATFRERPVEIATLIDLIHKKKCIAMADCSNIDEALNASNLGADIVASTLSGYTTKKIPKNPDFKIISEYSKNNLQNPMIAEGRINTPNQALKAIELGAHAVVVGTAINRVEIITSWFANGIRNDK